MGGEGEGVSGCLCVCEGGDEVCVNKTFWEDREARVCVPGAAGSREQEVTKTTNPGKQDKRGMLRENETKSMINC